jgi:uncharacterized protein DUF6624
VSSAEQEGAPLPKRRRWRYVLVAVFVVLVALLVVGYRQLGRNPGLAIELLKMRLDDRRVREKEIAHGLEDPPYSREYSAINDERMRLDRRHTARLDEIVDRYGWPDRGLVGRSGSHAAWLLAQHADLEFQERVLPLLLKADVDPHDVAYMTDRVRVRNDKKQIYGTQYTCRNGRLTLTTPVADIERVDERRAKAGLPSLEENRRDVDRRYGACPRDNP